MSTPLLTLDLRHVRRRDVATLLATGRREVVRRRRDPDVALAKLLATTGGRFSPRDVRPTRWALLTCRTDGQPAAGWPDAQRPRPGERQARLTLRPLASRGRWDGRDPFPVSQVTHRAGWTGPVAVLTRATLRPRHVRTFYAAVPAIAAEIATATGVTTAFGFGEAPILRQGTFSLWRSAAALGDFGRHATAHLDAVRRTPAVGWYAEDLFAYFAVVDAAGSLDGITLDTGLAA